MRNGKYKLVIAPQDYPGKRYRNRYAYAHRVRWWQETGHNPDGLNIHHKDDDKHNNEIGNLQAMTAGVHAAYHKPPKLTYQVCPQCGQMFVKRKRPVQKYCSRKCSGVAQRQQRPAVNREVIGSNPITGAKQ